MRPGRRARTDAGADSKVADGAGSLAGEQRALHWPLAFPEVFARDNPGFDVIVGNPPWEEVKVEELAFYARTGRDPRTVGR